MVKQNSRAIIFKERMNSGLEKLEQFAGEFPEVKEVWFATDLPLKDKKGLSTRIKESGVEKIIIAGESPGELKSFVSASMVSAGNAPENVLLASFKEHGASTKRDIDRAKAILACAIYDVPFEIAASPEEVTVNPDTVVIGAGIAGIQASLEIADSGNKVYLVEKTGTIGGHMAMFDKTFPTLDCAACILTPKMVQVGQHPNIELLTLSEVQELTGTAGNFKVKINKKARHVNDKCTGCGDCEVFCPIINKPQIQPLPEYSKQIESEEIDKLNRIFSKYPSVTPGVPGEDMLIQILQDVSLEYNYLPEYSLKYVSEVLRVPLSRVYHVATFYTAFSLTPRGEHLIKVCMGTACYARGAQSILDRFETILDIKPDETTEDGKFTLQTVGCLGCCALGPVVDTDGDYHQMTISKVDKLVDHYYKKEK